MQAVVDTLQQIFYKDEYADKAVPALLRKHKEWGARDRQFVAETIYDGVRWWRKYWHAMGCTPTFTEPEIHYFLAISLMSRGYTLLNPEILGVTDVVALQKMLYQTFPKAVEHSLPDWLYETIQTELGDLADATITALNQLPTVYLRVNTL